MRVPRRWAAVAVVASIALAAAGCSGGGTTSTGSKHGTTMTIGTTVPLNSLDPIGSTGTSYPFQYLIFDTLIDFDKETLQLKPGLATAWKFENPTTFVLTLRDGVTFSNGEKLDAAAVKGSLERYMAKGVLLPLTMVKSIDARSATEVVLNLKYEYASLPELLADCAGMILAPASVKASPDKDMGDKAIGAGPYVLKENHAGASATFAPNPTYWDKANAAKLTALSFTFFKDNVSMSNALTTHQIDGAVRMQPGDLSAFDKSSDYQVFKRASLGLQTVWFNWENEKLRNPKVRQAFNYAMDRGALNQLLTEGIGSPADQVWPPSYPMYDKSFAGFPHDVAKAKQLLTEAGLPNGTTIDCIFLPGTGWETLAPALVAQVAEAGIKVNLRQVSIAESIAAFTSPAAGTKGADCEMAGFVGYITPGGALANLSDSRSFYTPATTDGGLDAIIDKFNTAYTVEEKAKLASEWHQQEMQTPVLAPVANRAKIAVMSKDVTGYINGLLTPEIFRGLGWAQS